MFAPSELTMWQASKPPKKSKKTPTEINEKYVNGEQRIVTETNREKLPNFVAALDNEGYMQLRPFYQRRTRWDDERQSKLIESFIINIPVPPVFLYEKAYNQYEVMDGQQRIMAIQSFYGNEYALAGLEIWPELNGMRYKELPDKVKAGLDRRAISSIVLLKESAPDEEEAIILRQQVFERLNTGGIKLERQEIRNALGDGQFNSLLVEISRLASFRSIWGLPDYAAEEEHNYQLPIYENPFFAKMEDLEVVLRFFALRHMRNFRYGLQGFLDLYMIRAKGFSNLDLSHLKQLYVDTLEFGRSVFGEYLFKAFADETWDSQPLKGVYDAQMVALADFLDKKKEVIALKDKVVEKMKNEFIVNGIGKFTGRASTKNDIENRIESVRNILKEVLDGNI